MKLVIDSREADLFKNVTDFVKTNDLDINIEKQQLDLGDALILDDNDKELIIFERKSLNDLCASITDGRYKEQSFRLQQHPLHNHNIYYLIEGVIEKFVPQKFNRISRKAIYSTLVTLNYHKGFTVMRTTSCLETSRLLIFTYEKMKKENKPSYYEKKCEDPADYSSVVKCAKKDQITTENIHQIMLMQIPGVSQMVAKTIMSKFDGMVDLIASLQEDDTALNDIMVKTKTDKSRALSKTAIANIKKYLLGE